MTYFNGPTPRRRYSRADRKSGKAIRAIRSSMRGPAPTPPWALPRTRFDWYRLGLPIPDHYWPFGGGGW